MPDPAAHRAAAHEGTAFDAAGSDAPTPPDTAASTDTAVSNDTATPDDTAARESAASDTPYADSRTADPTVSQPSDTTARDRNPGFARAEETVRYAVVSRPLTFADLGLPPVLVHALRRDGIERPFPIQGAVIPDVLAGRDVLGRAATGAGKTLAFGVPMLVRLSGAPARPGRPRGVILAPTRELAQQIEAALDEPALSQGIRLASAVGGLPIKRQEERLARGVDLLIATPGRLTDLIGRRAVDLSEVRAITVDEADHMAELGFLPQLTAVLNRIPEDAQKLLFSATLDQAVDGLVERYLRDPVRHTVSGRPGEAEHGAPSPHHRRGTGRAERAGTVSDTPNHPGDEADSPTAGPRAAHGSADRDRPPPRATYGSRVPSDRPGGEAVAEHDRTVGHYAVRVRRGDKYAVVAEIAARAGRTLLFVRTQYGVDKLARRLREAGVAAAALHGGKAQNQRTRTLAVFAAGTAPVLVATDVAARGIHVDGIDLVVHVDPPADPKDYVHRAGRTARAGATGTVVTIVTPADQEPWGAIVSAAGVSVTDIDARPGDRRLAELIGARRPSGSPVPDPASPIGPETTTPQQVSPSEPRRPRPTSRSGSRVHTKKRKPGSARRSR
ncbi:DEAD/DEAH box helicase [Nocardia otitidiscaviarum]|uniref:DEAD/DEAH box helicase n=1 Tax=Nocardia otitidiscaviarum TaxID=1823 RepID=UPI002454F07D|nr:DEAD/DEAH box helicase [Nocardia otitidiscaviarum]